MLLICYYVVLLELQSRNMEFYNRGRQSMRRLSGGKQRIFNGSTPVGVVCYVS
jgi:hypothetical protein